MIKIVSGYQPRQFGAEIQCFGDRLSLSVRLLQTRKQSPKLRLKLITYLKYQTLTRSFVIYEDH